MDGITHRRVIRVALAVTAAAWVLLAGTNTAPAVGAVRVESLSAAPPAVPPAVPAVLPTPQQVRPRPDGFPLTPTVGLVTGPKTDAEAVRVTETAMRDAGVSRIVEAADSAAAPDTPTTIWLGGPDENRASAGALSALGVAGPGSLPGEGYVLAVGRDGNDQARAVLAGAGRAGTYYAAQTFRQLLVPHDGRTWLPGVEIRDWPTMRLRGGMEVHYGPSWSHQDRMRQIAFYGREKLNQFAYGTGEDPYTQARWRDLYPADKLAELADEVALARRDHVEFRYHIYPSVSGFVPPSDPARICFSDESDFAALLAKAQQLWDIGVRSFAIGFDDVSAGFRCDQDRQRFGEGPVAMAKAQTYLLNRFDSDFIATHDGAQRLTTIPSEFWGTQHSAYRDQLAGSLNADVIVMWTGPDVVSSAITATQADQTAEVFGHDILIFDNYPVNDYARNRLFLGPLEGRDPALGSHVLGLDSNTMNEADASQIPLATTADFTWNPAGYNAERSWGESLREFGGAVSGALRRFAENSRSSLLDPAESATLTPLLAGFKTAYDSGRSLDGDASALLSALDAARDAPDTLRAGLDDAGFLDQAGPYLDKLHAYASGGRAAVSMLLAQRSDDPATAWAARLGLDDNAATAAQIPQQIATPYGQQGIFEPFFAWARQHDDEFFLGSPQAEYGDIAATGSPEGTPGAGAGAAADGDLETAYRAARSPATGDALTLTLPLSHHLDRVVVLQDARAPAQANVQVRGPDGSWVDVGDLSGAYTSLSTAGTVTNAIRLAWSQGSPAPVVHEVIPVYADALPVKVVPAPSRLLAEPGDSRRLEVSVQPLTSEPLTGTLRVMLPDGWSADPESQPFTVDGGVSQQTVDLDVPGDAAPGTYPVRFVAETADGRFASGRATVQVVAPDSYPGVVLSAHPAGYWRLDEPTGTTAFDSSANADDGGYQPPVALGQPGALTGDEDAAVELTGGYVQVPDSPAVSVTGDFTLEAWIKPTRTDQQQGIIEKYDCAPCSNGYGLRLLDSGRLAAFTVGADGAIGYVEGPTPVSAQQWHHVVAVYDGSTIRIYLDGQLDGQTATTVDATDGPASLKLGARGDDAATRLSGSLDEVAIYDHPLTTQQIQQHYAAGTS